MAGGEGDNNDSPPASARFRRSDYRGLDIVTALHEDVGRQQLDEAQWRVFLERHHRVDHLQSPQHEGAVSRGSNRTCWSLEAPHGVIRVDANDQRITLFARRQEQVDVAGVEQVEHPVGEDHWARLRTAPCAGDLIRHHLVAGVFHDQKVAAAVGANRTVRTKPGSSRFS